MPVYLKVYGLCSVNVAYLWLSAANSAQRSLVASARSGRVHSPPRRVAMRPFARLLRTLVCIRIRDIHKDDSGLCYALRHCDLSIRLSVCLSVCLSHASSSTTVRVGAVISTEHQ